MEKVISCDAILFSSLFESQMITCPKRSKVSFHGGLGVCHCLRWLMGFSFGKHHPHSSEADQHVSRE